jgi:hypothetical protein
MALTNTVDPKLDVQKLTVPQDVLRFRLPFSMLISGPTLGNILNRKLTNK